MNANLRLQDLYGREREGETKLLALYVPKELTTRIDRLAKGIGKGDVWDELLQLSLRLA